MGKRAQLKRQKQQEAERLRRETVKQIMRSRQPWLNFWRRANFWIFSVCLVLLILFPFVKPSLDQAKGIVSGDRAVIRTSLGNIEVELYKNDASKTAENFSLLAGRGYYNNLTFHRVIKDFMIQGGDPNGDGTGGESAFGKSFEDEINPKSLGLLDDQIKQFEGQGYRYNYGLKSHKMDAGSLAMANSGPNTNGSQFFIVTEKSQPHLDGKHTVFGKVVKGMEIVRAIAAVPVDDKDKPKEPVYIKSIEIK